ncbi:hypothetical protein [uncultured Paenibacillus sp.]|uniref:hypothetical protein n=1 Tax=uncultured Paenibacillus sp. TaxID=227322 RepID=UPI0015AD7C6C|nr:hypothetical protein [uncultured Paenibacillus sp.]
MYSYEETILEMERRHASRLQLLDQSADRLEKVLLELPVPQNVRAYAYMQGLTRFHKSLLALRLLVVSGFGDEAADALRRLTEAAVLVKYVSISEEPQVWPLVEGAGFIPAVQAEAVKPDVPDLRTFAEQAGMPEWKDDLLPGDFLGGLDPQSETEEPEDWFPPIGPAPFDAAGLLSKGCRLAGILLDSVPGCGS